MPKPRLSLAQQIEQKKAQLQQLEARISKEVKKADTQRKIVIGGMVLAEMKSDERFRAQIVALLRERVTRPADRKAVAEWLSTDSPQA